MDLSHSPADIIAPIVRGQGYTTFVNSQPDTPDRCVTVYDTVGVVHGRTQIDGKTQEHFGLMLRFRTQAHQEVWQDLFQLREYLTQNVKNHLVTVDGIDYEVHALTVASQVMVGKEPVSNRRLSTLNLLASISPA